MRPCRSARCGSPTASTLRSRTGAPTLQTPFPVLHLATQLRTVARLIAARDRLQMSRQIFFVSTGGFDTHDNQVADQPGLLVQRRHQGVLRCAVELGVSHSVTTFTQSDFGRTLTSNGDGSDHAWGGVQFVVGGAVRGRTFTVTIRYLRSVARSMSAAAA